MKVNLSNLASVEIISGLTRGLVQVYRLDIPVSLEAPHGITISDKLTGAESGEVFFNRALLSKLSPLGVIAKLEYHP